MTNFDLNAPLHVEAITGVILAGGRGSRMGGADKGLQNFNGVPLALHTLLKLSPQVGVIMINANRNLAAYESFGAPVWPDSTGLGEYAGAPGTSLYIEVAMQHIPQIIFDSCQQLRVSRQEIEWVHPDWQVEFERLSAEHGEIEGIDRSCLTELLQSNEREPIDCFYHALEIYKRPKFPEHWAMLQHNLGLAYFERIKGERGENLQKSIECYKKSLEVFTQDKFLEKWQINQEDLSQSKEALEVEEQNFISPTFKSKLNC